MGQAEPQPLIRTNLPPYLLEQIAPIEREAIVQLRMGRYAEAEELYRTELGRFVEAEGRERRSLHKGTPYHQIGVCLYLRGVFNDSLENFLLAYCEDALSAETGQEDNQDRAPACNVLRSTFVIDLTFLGAIKRIAHRAKTDGEIPLDPNEILSAALEEHAIDRANILNLLMLEAGNLGARPLDPIVAAWQRRVFIGGQFNDIARLRDIQEEVIRLNYDPVLTDEVVGVDQLVHHHCLMLLHTCRFAIFEVTNNAGQLIELERARDYEIQPLVLYSSRNREELNPPPYISAMVRSAGFNIRNYRDSAQLRERIGEYLPH